MVLNKSVVNIGIWIFLTLLLSYQYSYPFDIFSYGAFLWQTDISLSMWIFNWQLTQLSSGNLEFLFSGNMFFPLENSAVFSVNMLSTAILSLPLFLITGNSELCYNTFNFLSFLLCSFSMFLLARRLKLDISSAIVASLIFSFSEFRLYIHSYLNLTTMQWMPLTLLFLHRYFDEGNKRNLIWASIFYCLQITASAHIGIFFSILLLAFTAVLFSQNPSLNWKTFFRDSAVPVFIALIIATANYYPYWKVAHNLGFERDFDEQIRYGANLEAYLSAAHSYFLGPLTKNFGKSEGFASPRYIAIFLTIFALVAYRVKALPSSYLRKFDLILVITAAVAWLVWKYQTLLVSAILGNLSFTDTWDDRVFQLIYRTPIVFLVLARLSLTGFAISIFKGLRNHKILLPYSIFALLAFIISLGPLIKVNDYELALNPITTILFFIFPGFDSIRAVSRISGLVPLGLAITSGIGFSILRTKIDNRVLKNMTSVLVLALLLFEIYPAKGLNYPHRKRPEVQAEYLWLKETSIAGPVLEWPVHSPFDGNSIYVERSIIHKKPLVNGFGSYEWSGQKKLGGIKDLSTQESLLSLYAFGVRYLLVHRVAGVFPSWAIERMGNFRLIREFKDTRLYVHEKAATQFLPEDFWANFKFSLETKSSSKCYLILKFQSPETYFISKKKKTLTAIWDRGPDLPPQKLKITFYPTLWRHEDIFRLKKITGKECQATDQGSIGIGAVNSKEPPVILDFQSTQ